MEIKEMLETVDKLYAAGSLGEAEANMLSWIDDAKRDKRPAIVLALYNEMEGLYRTTGRAAQAAEISDKALALVKEMGLEGTLPHGTTLLNGATANRVAGNLDKALAMYQEAEAIYRSLGESSGYHMASLYNNISQIYQEKGRHEEALEKLRAALALITGMEGSEAEAATTRVNMSFSFMALEQFDEAAQMLEDAMAYYRGSKGAGDPHGSSALSAAGELAFRRGEYERAEELLEEALNATLRFYGESDACRIIRGNLEQVRKKKAEASAE